MRAYISAVMSSYLASRMCGRADRKAVKREGHHHAKAAEKGRFALKIPLSPPPKNVHRNRLEALSKSPKSKTEEFRERSKFKLTDMTVMKVMEFSDIPSAIAFMKASRKISHVLKGKLKKRFWEMAFWRDHGVLLYLNQIIPASLPRSLSLSQLPKDTTKWSWRHYLEVYYSSEYSSKLKHIAFGRCTESRIQDFRRIARQTHNSQASALHKRLFEHALRMSVPERKS
eukprot:CAMPEP_0197530112 /NCGR_PEP_ID=MMETSP1318-20131121/30716_1 /TAXON_ID=552666 /ORGANISM="Partenskyella glossopodia, Strain RCC365" /LENGTH=227 /DNA_ID=CAMNT_0043085807 /DNA_START=14 /DNA_END=697 /DNA_ORIENTATION=+